MMQHIIFQPEIINNHFLADDTDFVLRISVD